jgi:hypothetical protein
VEYVVPIRSGVGWVMADVLRRSVSSNGGCEDGEDRFGIWACVWTCAGCDGYDEGEAAGLCRVYIEGRETESGLYANGGHIRIQLRFVE